MAFSSNSSGGGPMADITVTPLVDVMLVLLIIFMITAPLMSHKVKVDLPQATLEQKPVIEQPPITLAVQANGRVYWNDEAVNNDMLEARLAVLAYNAFVRANRWRRSRAGRARTCRTSSTCCGSRVGEMPAKR